ncbi:unnamed protein product [Prunus armeniaca]
MLDCLRTLNEIKSMYPCRKLPRGARPFFFYYFFSVLIFLLTDIFPFLFAGPLVFNPLAKRSGVQPLPLFLCFFHSSFLLLSSLLTFFFSLFFFAANK